MWITFPNWQDKQIEDQRQDVTFLTPGPVIFLSVVYNVKVSVGFSPKLVFSTVTFYL